MPSVKINGITYDFETLSDELKNHLKYLAFIDSEVERLNLQLNVLRISREEIGRQLDSALLRQELNQSQPVGEASQNSL
jgi:archaellum component FlaC